MRKYLPALIALLTCGISSIFYEIFFKMGLNSISISYYNALYSVFTIFCIKLYKDKSFKFFKISKRDLLLSFVTTGLFGLFVTNISIVTSLKFIPVGIQQLITNSNPLLIILISVIFLHKKMSKKDVISALLIIFGLYLIMGNIVSSGSSNMILGVMICTLSIISIAVYSTILNENKATTDILTFWFYAYLGFFVATLISLSIVGWKELYLVHSLKYFLILYPSITISYTLSYIAYIKSIDSVGSVKTSIISSLSPVITIIIASIFLKQDITYVQYLGGFMILLSPFVSIF